MDGVFINTVTSITAGKPGNSNIVLFWRSVALEILSNKV